MQGLEKAPLTKIAAEPIELLDKTRYQFCRKQLTCEKEDRLNTVLGEMASRAAKRGILVKPFFEDASRDPNSARMINHVTPQQFKQVRSWQDKQLPKFTLICPINSSAAWDGTYSPRKISWNCCICDVDVPQIANDGGLHVVEDCGHSTCCLPSHEEPVDLYFPCIRAKVPCVCYPTQKYHLRHHHSWGVQVLNVKLGMNVEPRDLELLIEKYITEDYGDLVNYVAFSSRVDPSEPNFDPYTLGA